MLLKLFVPSAILYLTHVECMGRKKKKGGKFLENAGVCAPKVLLGVAVGTVPRADGVVAAKKRREKKVERRKAVQAKGQDGHVQSSTGTGYSVEDYMTKVSH